MTIAELRERLGKDGFKPDWYYIEGKGSLPPYEGLLLEKSGTLWQINFFERGMRRSLESFSDEAQACQRMYELPLEYFVSRH